jgi:hypothetical protein
VEKERGVDGGGNECKSVVAGTVVLLMLLVLRLVLRLVLLLLLVL